MKKFSSTKIIIAVCIAICLVCAIILFLQLDSCDSTPGYEETVLYPSTQESEEETSTATDEPTEPTEYVSPIDWESLKEQNSEIYAWLYIPGTEISYPIVQSETDDTFYLTHDAYKVSYKGGAIFSEKAYNDLTFDEPVTLLYGHKLRSGAMLGTLQSTYNNSEGFEAHRDIIIYMPDKELRYTVWASTEYSSDHIMYKYEKFIKPLNVTRFINEIKNIRSVEGQLDESLDVDCDDKFIVLSTCLMGQVSRRYLVIAQLNTAE